MCSKIIPAREGTCHKLNIYSCTAGCLNSNLIHCQVQQKNNCLVKRQAKKHASSRVYQVRSCQELRVQQSSQPFACLSKTCPTHRKKLCSTLIIWERVCPDAAWSQITIGHCFVAILTGLQPRFVDSKASVVSAVKIRKGTLRLKESCGVIQIIKCQVCQVMDCVRKERCRWGTSSGHLV